MFKFFIRVFRCFSYLQFLFFFSFSRLEVFRGVWNILQNVLENTCLGVFSLSCRIKTCTFVKKGLRHRCFPMNFAKYLINIFCRTSANVEVTYVKIYIAWSFCQLSTWWKMFTLMLTKQAGKLHISQWSF